MTEDDHKLFIMEFEEILAQAFLDFRKSTGVGNTPEARVLCYTSLLEAAKADPFEADPLMQAFAETKIEMEILKAGNHILANEVLLARAETQLKDL